MSHFPWNSKYNIKCSHVVRSKLKEQDGGEASSLPANIKAFLLQLLTIAWLREDQSKKNLVWFGHCPKIEWSIFGAFFCPRKVLIIFLRSWCMNMCYTNKLQHCQIRVRGQKIFNKKIITDIVCTCSFLKYFLKTFPRILQKMENLKVHLLGYMRKQINLW